MIGFKQTATVALLATGLVFGSTAQAALIDRGSGLIYDDVLNVTWLQDANYAKTSGYSVTGIMDWTSAKTWAANLVYHDSLRNVDYSDWRLASNTPINGINYNIHYFANGVADIGFSSNGTTDVGYNITSPLSELAYMYNVNLGLKGYVNSIGNFQSNFGIFGNGTFNGVDRSNYSLAHNNVGRITNLSGYGYWSGTEAPNSKDAFSFLTLYGYQDIDSKTINLYAWAVRPGDVAAVPLPSTIWLFASGLGLLSFTRRKKQSS